MERPDNSVRDRAGLAQVFRHFGRFEAPQVAAPLYEELCEGIAEDPELLDIAAHSKVGQPAPNLLLGAVHQLLIQGIAHPLRSHYATLCAPGETPQGDAVPLFRDFCLAHRAEIEARVAKRVTQTNVIQRCSLLLPAFAQVFEEGGRRPLALIEVGCSAGLNLN